MTTYDVLEYIPSVIRPTLMMDMSSSTLLQHVIAALVGSFVPWIVMYGSVLSLVLVFADQLKPHKLDARPVDMKFLMTEIRRSCNSCLLLAAWDVFLTRHVKGAVDPTPGALFDPYFIVTILPLTLVWADIHFYAIHRFLHSHPLLYKHIHKIHHESINTNVMSGLSFHPVEGFLYFSSLALVLIAPMTRFQFFVFKLGLQISPIGGHIGYTITNVENNEFDLNKAEHYTHHVKFNYNYGSGLFPEGMIWDSVLKTVWDTSKPISKRLRVKKK